MVDRVRSEQGDPRYFLAQLKKKQKGMQGNSAFAVFLHRLPHMKMNKKKHEWLNALLLGFVVVFTLLWDYTKILY